MSETPIDSAFQRLAADPDDPGVSLQFHERVLDAELLVPLAAETGGVDDLMPQVYDVADGRFVLAFDRDERMAAFLEAPVPFAALTGRQLAGLLAGKGAGIVLNPGAPSETLLPAATVGWLASMVAGAPLTVKASLHDIGPPETPPAALVDALGPKLAAMAEVIGDAHLVSARHDGKEARYLLVLSDVSEAAHPGVAAAIAEAVRFSTTGSGLDVAFVASGSPAGRAAARAGLLLDLPRPRRREIAGPGMDPDRPPKL